MGKDKSEEKSYKSWRKFVADHRIWTPMLGKACKIAEKQGYNKAKKSLFSEKIKTQAAFKECISKLEVCRNLLDAHVDATLDLTETLAKSKILLTDNTEENDKR